MKYPVELKNKIRELNSKGFDDPDIAIELAMDRRTICYLRSKMGIKSIRNNRFRPEHKDFKQKLEESEVILVSPENKGTDKHLQYEVKCKHCGKIFLKLSHTIGKTKCQCIKTISGAHNFEGYNLISKRYFISCSNGAFSRGISFNISIQDMWKKWVEQKGKCALSGVELKIGTNIRKRKDFTASLDRIDSKVGYEYSNIQWVHKDLNKMKMNFPNEYFIEMCKLVAKQQNYKNE